MKKLLLLSAGVALAGAAPALAQSASDSVSFDVTASIAQECSVEQPSAVSYDTPLQINTAPGDEALTITQGSARIGQDLWVSCNYGASMTLRAEPMTADNVTNNGPDAADFTDWMQLSATIESSTGNAFKKLFANSGETGGEDTTTNADAFHDRAKLVTILSNNGVRPLADTYTGAVTLSVFPA